jgi:hypothetical protein
MDRRPGPPRGLVSRSLVAVGIFAAVVVPGWTLGDLFERWTGNGLADWLVTCGWTAAAVFVLAPRSSYRRRDAVLGLVPLLGWYLTALMSWRVALLPYRDWEPRGDELWRARWLTGGLIGFWRSDPVPAAPRRHRQKQRLSVPKDVRG